MLSYDKTSEVPYRIAISNNFNGGDYVYGGHVEFREYADTTFVWVPVGSPPALVDEYFRQAEKLCKARNKRAKWSQEKKIAETNRLVRRIQEAVSHD